ncbi:VPS52, partial [Symbiodinium sp. KB8]
PPFMMLLLYFSVDRGVWRCLANTVRVTMLLSQGVLLGLDDGQLHAENWPIYVSLMFGGIVGLLVGNRLAEKVDAAAFQRWLLLFLLAGACLMLSSVNAVLSTGAAFLVFLAAVLVLVVPSLTSRRVSQLGLVTAEELCPASQAELENINEHIRLCEQAKRLLRLLVGEFFDLSFAILVQSFRHFDPFHGSIHFPRGRLADRSNRPDPGCFDGLYYTRDECCGTKHTAQANHPEYLVQSLYEQLGMEQEYQRLTARRLEHLASLALPLWSRRVLELGARQGDLTHFFTDRGCNVTIVEPRKSNIVTLRQRLFLGHLFPEPGRVEIRSMDVEDSLPQGDWDIVFCYGLLYHLQEPERFLEKVAPLVSELLLLETVVSAFVRDADEPPEPASMSLRGRVRFLRREDIFRLLKGLFPYAYVPATQPNHEQFETEWAHQSGRDAILEQLDRDPIIAHTNKDKIKYYHEQLFRSHQMLLMDTATSEFLFLNDFFDTKGEIGLFVEVFGKTTQYFLDALEGFLGNCWDSVGLLLMVRIVDFYRKRMQQRKVSCLDSYLDALQLLLWPRLRVVLDANIVSLRKAYQQNLQPPTNNNPHLVTRRFAELAASLYFLSSSEDSGLPDTLQQPLAAMRQEFCTLLSAMANRLDGQDSGLVFLVNNHDLVLTVFHERHLPRNATSVFEDLLRDQVQKFVESQLMRHYPDLVTFVKNTEPAVAKIDEATARSQPSQSPPPGVDVQKMEQVVRNFAANWKRERDQIHQYVMVSFSNFSNGMEILKQVLTQLLLYYTRLQKVILKTFPQQQPAFASEMVPNTTILMEVRRDNFA